MLIKKKLKYLLKKLHHQHHWKQLKRYLIEQKSASKISSLEIPWADLSQYSSHQNESKLDTSKITENSCLENNKKPRYNEFGIQMISDKLYKQLFSNNLKRIDRNLINQYFTDLKSYNFNKPQIASQDVDITLPPLEGSSLEEHFFNIGENQSKRYRELILDFLKSTPTMPSEWKMQPGWTRYSQSGVEPVDYPLENAIVFDVEVCCSAGPLPTLATAVTKEAWYGWVSNDVINSQKNIAKTFFTPDDLIPLESKLSSNSVDVIESLKRPRIVIGHNVSFDRAKVREQYWLEQTGTRFIDTMSMHVSISGVTSYQKALLKAGVVDEEWTKLSSLNNLGKVYELYCGKELSKSGREIFLEGKLTDVKHNFQTLMTYCANDVLATFLVMKEMFPIFLERFPHPVTLAGMLELQSTYVPVNENWNKYLSDSQQAFEDLNMEVKNVLKHSANEACKLLHENQFKKDLWLWDQEWSKKHLILKKTKSVNKILNGNNNNDEKQNLTQQECDVVEEKLVLLKEKFISQRDLFHYIPARKPHLPGYPKWYTKICNKPNDPLWIPEPELISTSMKIVPKLLRLTWKSMPLHHERGHGWGYILPYKTDIAIENADLLPLKNLVNYFISECEDNLCSCLMGEDENYNCVKKGTKRKQGDFCKAEIGVECGLRKLPHKDGNNLNVGNPLSRDFINKFSDNELSGASSHAKKVIEISRMLSYWRNNRERIENQFVCWLSKTDLPTICSSDYEIGAILPQVIVCGTLTRRAVEPTWMTVSNAIVERVGSELRGIVHAPPGFSLVGADVDSQELWIASLLGDAYSVGIHGATPFGWMTLNGQKRDGTDMHSVTAKAVGISRNNAKILNYARIYGAGQKFAERLLKQFNPEMTIAEASQKASKMMALTKGKRLYKLRNNRLPELKERTYTKEAAKELCLICQKAFDELFSSTQWCGGTESEMFNCLEEIANKDNPKTPFLNSQLSRALEPTLDDKDKFATTRINWVVQSGAVDFLHLMLVSMRWFIGSKGRFCLSFHDEVRYLVPENVKYEAALALHVTNLLTRAFCVKKLGMTDLPQSVAFFSAVDVDVVLRKEANDDNKTPSNPFGLNKGYGVPIGESLDIYKSVEKAKGVIGLR